ncbi:MAG: hypothetical protein COU07_03410 [Candidatus Harrisonbacteria bacterium CG10_big_fil_rev_8_21_14_0_10_40_38]|uniref:Uncharacterized protein n=1 Tax=Candidatus Harrisonbacteria bacterium CG10_big_fil_rev_8_21_14_0_10_40_38 TaxID=1974583 RepID=A0A2H0UR67_9BACT|nr:MAG: hypothetical protein COU07_03410 [Candidatus Harrisonbacteria bacterium CG10_big_fil_rev_8_21_14_0_10_40_38]
MKIAHRFASLSIVLSIFFALTPILRADDGLKGKSVSYTGNAITFTVSFGPEVNGTSTALISGTIDGKDFVAAAWVRQLDDGMLALCSAPGSDELPVIEVGDPPRVKKYRFNPWIDPTEFGQDEPFPGGGVQDVGNRGPVRYRPLRGRST